MPWSGDWWELVEDVAASVGMVGSAVRWWSPMAISTDRSGRRVRTSFLIVTPVASCRWRAMARAANTTILLCSVKPGTG